MFRASKLWNVSSTSGPRATENPNRPKRSISSSAVWVKGWRWPSLGTGVPGRVTSIPPTTDAGRSTRALADSQAASRAALTPLNRCPKARLDSPGIVLMISCAALIFPCFWPRNSIRADSTSAGVFAS